MDSARPMPDPRPDAREIGRNAVARRAIARRQGLFRAAWTWGRIATKARRFLRFAARQRTARIWLIDTRAVRTHPHCSHPLFSGQQQNVRTPPTPIPALTPDRRRAFRERLRRR